MSGLIRVPITVTTDANGDATAYSARRVSGLVYAVRYVPATVAPLTATTDVAITAEDSGLPIISLTDQPNAPGSYAPRMATHTTAGAAALYAASGVAVNDKIPVSNERIKVVVSQGGDTKTGTFHLYLGCAS